MIYIKLFILISVQASTKTSTLVLPNNRASRGGEICGLSLPRRNPYTLIYFQIRDQRGQSPFRESTSE